MEVRRKLGEVGDGRREEKRRVWRRRVVWDGVVGRGRLRETKSSRS